MIEIKLTHWAYGELAEQTSRFTSGEPHVVEAIRAFNLYGNPVRMSERAWRWLSEKLAMEIVADSQQSNRALCRVKKAIDARLKEPLTPDEMQILDACILGETATGIATWTAFPIGKTRRLLKSLHRRGLVRKQEMRFHDGGRLENIWTREGPED